VTVNIHRCYAVPPYSFAYSTTKTASKHPITVTQHYTTRISRRNHTWLTMFHSFHNLKCDSFRNPDLSQTRVPQMQYRNNNGVERDKTQL